MSEKLSALLRSGDNPVVGPVSAAELRRFVSDAPVMALASPEDFENALSALSLGTSGKRLSPPEAKAQMAIYERVLADLPARDLERAVTKLLRESTFMPTPAELRKAAMSFKAKREFALSRARYLILLHDRNYVPTAEPSELVQPGELSGLLGGVSEQFPSQRDEAA